MAAAQHSGSNPLFQFFHVERNLVFHCGPFFCSLVSLGTSGPTSSFGIGGPTGIRRPVHGRQTPTRCLGQLCRYQWPEGCGLAPLETSLPGFPLFDGPNPLGAIRSSNSSIWTSWISSFIFVLPFLSFFDSPQRRKLTTETRNDSRFPSYG